MSDKFKNSKFYRTMKNPKVSRALYVAVSLLLIAMAVVIGITAAANRSKKNNGATPPPSVNDTTRPPVTDNTPVTDSTPADTTTGNSAENDSPSSPVVSTVPTFSLPVSGKLTKDHDSKVQFFSETMNDYRVHLGIDIATAEGAPVYAAANGTVKRIWKDALMGYCVAIEHSGDSLTVYKNLSDVLPDGIIEGASVRAGQQIASVGDSAMIEIADEPHLHFEVSVGGILEDPLEHFAQKDLTVLKNDNSYGE